MYKNNAFKIASWIHVILSDTSFKQHTVVFARLPLWMQWVISQNLSQNDPQDEN